MSSKPETLPTPASIAKYVKQNIQKAQKSSAMMDMMMHHAGGQEVVREDDYKGHHIVVTTKYNITVDGQEVTGHLMLTNEGQVQYHGLPNHSFDSTVELARALIDKFPEDFEKKRQQPKSHDAMDMGGGGTAKAGSRGSMGGMKMPSHGAAISPKATSKKKSVPQSRQRARNKSK